MDRLPVSKLKGINIYTDNDLYDVAVLMLKLIDAKARLERSNSKSRPTVNGFAKQFAQFIDNLYPDDNKVFMAIKEHKLPLGAVIDFDESL